MTPADIPLHPAVTVLDTNNDGIVALNKPTGIRSHPNNSKDHSATLIRADYDFDQECYHWRTPAGQRRCCWLINRLDSPTSGILLIALNEAISRVIKQQFAQHQVHKTYYALVRNRPKQNRGIWEDFIPKHADYRQSRQSQTVRAQTQFKWLAASQSSPTISLLELCPITGRTHQLRRQCQLHACPILGDQTYGDFQFNRSMLKKAAPKRLFLHAARIQIQYDIHTKVRKLDIHCPRPQSFNAVLNHSQAADITKITQHLPHRRFKRP
jgi:23S rRNA-/tRNA-specific pseudouridylate synthase